MAKEAFSLYAIGRILSTAHRTDLFDINIFVLNMVPPSFIEEANESPMTRHHVFTVRRGVIYEDLGKIIPQMKFDLKVIITR